MGGTAKKTGKGRLDRFYHLAKEQGYRARSAFKLIQLARKYNFLASARSCIDLCGAPGGWSQVAVKTMPVGSKVICVDLSPIKPMRGVVTMQCDITTPTCRSLLRKELGKTGQVDVVLNDGAPNVGANWSKDAFTQAELTLAACKLAVELLVPGGTFVTKVFRSADYSSLLWVFRQLFGKVEATKPSASRDVSAEIFVVCQDFKAPREIDPKLLDPKFVFMLDETPEEDKKPVGLNALLKDLLARKRKRDGYAEGDEYRVIQLSQWLRSKTAAEELVSSHKISIDVPNVQVSEEMKILLSDLKVIGKGDFMGIWKWRSKLLGEEVKEEGEDSTKAKKKAAGEDSTASSGDELDDLLAKKKREDRRDAKRLREKDKKASWRKRMNAGMTGMEEEPDLFSVRDLLTDDTHAAVTDEAADLLDAADGQVVEEAIGSGDEDLRIAQYEVLRDSDDETKVARMEKELADDYARRQGRRQDAEGNYEKAKSGKKVTRREQVVSQWAQEMSSFAAGIDKKAEQGRVSALAYMGDSDSESDDQNDTPFMTRGDAFMDRAAGVEEEEVKQPAKKKQKKVQQPERPATREEQIKADRFFSNPLFKDATAVDSDEEPEVSLKARNADEIDELSESELPNLPLCDKKAKKEKNRAKKQREALRSSKKDEFAEEADTQFEVVPSSNPETLKPEDPQELAETLAYGHLLIHKKSRMQTIEAGYNRYTFDDQEQDLPEWFTSEEKQFSKPILPLTKELSQQLRAKMKEINARPIRKLAEAVGRKRQKAAQKLEKIRKQASSLAAAEDVGAGTKAKVISKAIAKTARDQQRKTVFTVINRQGAASKTVSKDAAGKGAKVKVVDRRMKKDRRAMKRVAKRR